MLSRWGDVTAVKHRCKALTRQVVDIRGKCSQQVQDVVSLIVTHNALALYG